ncbi:MAG TPA: cytochrome c3 family protein [Bryobacteraceae bacterium]|nr:cytochrome c3 family protein [Bryobacteraceae bacterium]
MHFSHKRHAELKLKCSYCHETVEKEALAGFPSVAKCMTCHRAVKTESEEIKKLAALPEDATPFPAHRVYELADFVVFSHARHRRAAIECRECHGDVEAHDTVTREVRMNMKWCVDCHKLRRASVACNICHELSQ